MYEDESVRQMIEDGSYKDIVPEQFQLFDEAKEKRQDQAHWLLHTRNTGNYAALS
mgnify:CR=1 FL=1